MDLHSRRQSWHECTFESKSYDFPLSCHGQKNRKVNHKWFGGHPWLAYSKKEDGLYCRTCLLFAAKKTKGGFPDKSFVGGPFKDWHNASAQMEKHEEYEYHKEAENLRHEVELHYLKDRHLNIDIDTVVMSWAAKRVAENRLNFKSVALPLLYLVRQAISIRGHRGESIDDIAAAAPTPQFVAAPSSSQSTQQSSAATHRNNPGNYVALIELLNNAGYDPRLRIIFSNDKAVRPPATYHSPESQNEIIDVYAHILNDRVLKLIKAAKWFSILCDEAADVSNSEQMAFCVRFVDATDIIREEFLQFIPLTGGQTGEKISEAILKAAKDFGLDMNDCVGQGYDGGGSMSGKEKGAAARILREFPDAHYFHCAAHQLSLCVSAIGSHSDIPALRNALCDIDALQLFYKFSPKRCDLLSKHMSDAELPGQQQRDQKRQMKGFARTRWLERVDCLEDFINYYEAHINTLNEIVEDTKSEWDKKTRDDARCLLLVIADFKSVYPIVFMSDILMILRPLTTILQGKSIDVITAYATIEHNIAVIKTMRDEIDKFSSRWFEKANMMVQSVDGNEAQLPRIPRRSLHAETRPALSVAQHFRQSVVVPALDLLISQLNGRFCELQSEAINGLCIVPTVWICGVGAAGLLSSEQKKDAILASAKMLRAPVHISKLEGELGCWARVCIGLRTQRNPEDKQLIHIPETLQETLLCKFIPWPAFPQVKLFVRYMATLPVTTCTCERSISMLRRVKTYLRATMGQERFTNLCVLHSSNVFSYEDMDEIIDSFVARNPKRKVELV